MSDSLRLTPRQREILQLIGREQLSSKSPSGKLESSLKDLRSHA